MLIDELKEKLKIIKQEIVIIETYLKSAKTEKELKTLLEIVKQENFWKNPNQKNISKNVQDLKEKIKEYKRIKGLFNELNELIDLFKSEEKELLQLTTELNKLQRVVSKFKINVLLNKEEDKSNCFLTINAGAGGTESQDWAEMLLRMYIRFCEKENLKIKIVDYQAGDAAGIKSATLFIKGKNAYGLLRSESGIHRLVRISPFDASKRRHTSFCAITITPEVPEIKIKVDQKDLRIDTYRASGAGGQHVNKTESAVRITHIPSKTVVQCQNERSQTQNKAIAMKMLISKLAQKNKEKELAKNKKIEKKKIEWGSQIRSYILHPYKMVKDHRTNIESHKPMSVLDGDIINFIEGYLIQSQLKNNI